MDVLEVGSEQTSRAHSRKREEEKRGSLGALGKSGNERNGAKAERDWLCASGFSGPVAGDYGCC